MPVTLAGNWVKDAQGLYAFGPVDEATGEGKAWKGIQVSGNFYAGGVVLYGPDGVTPLILDDAAFSPGTRYVLPIGAFADETAPDQVDEGDIGIPRMTLYRGLHVNPRDAVGDILFPTAATPAAGAANPTISKIGAFLSLFNGTTWDPQRNNSPIVTLLASAARTTSTASAAQVNYNWKSVLIGINVTVAGTGTLTPYIRVPGFGNLQLASFQTLTTTVDRLIALGTGIVLTNIVGHWSAATNVQGVPLPSDWDFLMGHSDGSSWTYQVRCFMCL